MVLLDTCVLYWLASDQSKISTPANAAIVGSSVSLHASAISAFEMAINHKKRRVILPSDPEDYFATLLARYAINCLSVDWRVAARSVELPSIHSDPADRMIVATALFHSMPIVTPDALIQAYPGVQVIW